MAKRRARKPPRTLGACADRLFELRAERLELQKQVDAIKSEEAAVKEKLINELPKSDAQGVSGKAARVKVLVQDVPSVKDWEKLYKYIGKHKAWDLMQRRLADRAIKERWEHGERVPGVEAFKVVKVSVTKL